MSCRHRHLAVSHSPAMTQDFCVDDWSHVFGTDHSYFPSPPLQFYPPSSYLTGFANNTLIYSPNAFPNETFTVDAPDASRTNFNPVELLSLDRPSLSTSTLWSKAERIAVDQAPTSGLASSNSNETLPAVRHVTPLHIACPRPTPASSTPPGPSRPSHPRVEPPQKPPRGGRKFPCGAPGCSRILTKQSLWKQVSPPSWFNFPQPVNVRLTTIYSIIHSMNAFILTRSVSSLYPLVAARLIDRMSMLPQPSAASLSDVAGSLPIGST